ncbi:MAG: hypothetical protein Q8S73_32655 [Deltaproteobacteria bacterium]|nr:hypothetical protein [Myxococcales bacterium]MDP3218897.1 hypothetical protein [Deltaproteobacteria bacterium]
MTARWLLWMAHGPKVFLGLVVVCALVGAWWGPIVARRVREARRQRRVGALGAAHDEVPAGEGVAVVLRGELTSTDAGSGVAAVTERFAALADGTPVPARTTVTGSLLLKTRSGLVRLPDDAEVLVGSVEERPGTATAEGPQVERRLSVEVGAMVRVDGVIEPAPGAMAQGYRGAAPSWRIVPGAHGRVRIAAEVAGGAARTGRAQRAAGAAATALIGAAAMTAAGQGTLAEAKARRGEVTVGVTRAWCDGSGATRAALASASPLGRRGALDEVALALRCARGRDGHAAAGLDQALRLRGVACVERAAAMATMGDLRRAAELGMTCGSAEAAVRAGWVLAGLGEFAQASAALDAGDAALRTESELHRAVGVHALAGAWAPAARTARRAAELAGGRRGERDEDPYTRVMWCVADAMAARGGEADAVERLERRLAMEGTPACRALRAEIALARGESTDAWTDASLGAHGWAADRVGRAGGWSMAFARRAAVTRAAPMRVCLEPSGACAQGSERTFDGLTLDAALALRPYQADLLGRYRSMATLDPAQATDAARLSVAEARVAGAAGEHAEAQGLARWAIEHAATLPRYERLAMLHTQAWLAAMSGDRGAVDAALGELEGEGEAAPSAMIPLAVRRWAGRDRAGLAGVALAAVDHRDAREALTAGRGDLLLAWLRRQPGVVPMAGRRAVLAAFHFGVLDRAEAGEWLRTEDVWLDPEAMHHTWRAASVRLAIATRVGDRATAESMRGVVQRHRRAASRRDLAMTLSLLDVY